MRANRIKVGQLVDISLGNPKAPEFMPLAAEVVDTEVDGAMVALRLRQEGKHRGCWVAMPATDQIPVLRR